MFQMDFLCKKILMTNKIYYLASCDTCRKIIKSLPNSDKLEFHDIRQNPITEKELEDLYSLSRSYEALFSKKAQLYKSLDLKNKALTEEDYKKYLLQHYTFLSRPVFIINDILYIGNGQKNIIEVIKVLSNV
jgi:arsenate reductase